MPCFVQDRPLDCSVMSLETLSSDSPLDNAIISTIKPLCIVNQRHQIQWILGSVVFESENASKQESTMQIVSIILQLQIVILN